MMIKSNFKTKCVSLILVLALLITMIPATAFAAETEAVSSGIKSFSIDKKSLVEGDVATITMETEGEWYPRYVSYYKPITNVTKQFSFSNISGNTYATTIAVDNQTESGLWEIRSIAFRNSDWDTEHVYNSNKLDSLIYDKVDFSTLDFEVSGTNADVISPILKSYSIDKESVELGKSVELSLIIEEENPVDKLTVRYLTPTGTDEWVYVTIKERQDLNVTYTGVINITDESPIGVWQPDVIYLEDINDNSPIVYNANVHTSGSPRVDLSSLDFEVIHAHKYNDEWTVDVEPTCTTEGSKSHHCSICGEKTDVTVIGVLAHDYSTEWTVDIEPTCGEEGSKSHHCIVCGDKEDVTAIGVLDHDYSSEWTVDVEPTCTTEGSKSHHCTRCEAKTDITVLTLVSHETERANQKDANCTEQGYTGEEVCKWCKDIIEKGESIDALGHEYSEEWTVDEEATCTESGSKSHHCIRCEAKTDETGIPATGHTYGNWIVQKAATSSEVGRQYKECACGDIVTEEIPKLDYTVMDPDQFSYEEYAKEKFNQVRITDVEHLFTEKYKGKCIIPSEIDGSPVVSIGYESFCDLDLSEVDLIIPESVTWIDGYSFVGTNAKSITILNPECELQSQSIFSSCTTLIGYPNSDVHKYAKSHGLNFKCIEHIWNASYTVDKEATCTEDGSKSIHCTACDEVKEGTVVNAIGHSWYNDENNIRICQNCGCSETNSDATNTSSNRDKLYEQISAKSSDGTNSVSFGNLSSNGYNYYFEVTEDKFFVQYKTKNSSWLKVIDFEYDYATGKVTSNFIQSGSSNYYAATATFDAGNFVSSDSIVYKDATGSNYGGMCVTYAENFAATAIPKINQKMMSEFGVSLYKIGFKSYSHTHSGGDATCCSYAECEVCGKVYGSLEEHTTEIKNQIYATCYEPGYTGDLVCTVCNEIIEYGHNIPIIEREEATGKFDLLKQYILKHGKIDAADNKYIYCSDVIYDANSNPIKVYSRITYMDEFAKFKLLYTSGEGDNQTSIVMSIEENGSDITEVEFVYEDLGLYANAPITVGDYKAGSNIYFEKVKDFMLSNDQIQSLCNSELKAAFATWDILLLEHLQLDMNMGNMGFISYETPATHTWSKATCTSAKNCKVCGETQGTALGHSYETVTTKATTSNDGVSKQICSTCGDVKSTKTIYKVSSIKLSTSNYTYNGKAQKPSVTVKDSKGATLKNGTDYTVSYASGRTKIGKYKVTVTFKGNYSESKVLYFEIGPKNPTTVKTALYGYDDVKVSWSKVSGVTGYKVYYKKSTASSWTLLKTTTATSYKKANLSDGVKYDFKVVAYKKVSGNNCENAGKTSSIYTMKKVAGVKAAKSGSKVKVSWTNISGESGYQISQSTSKSKTKIVATYKTTSGKYKTVSATKGKTYYYKVRAYKTVGRTKIYGPWSSVVKYKR